jgi:hypothetical protein
VQQPTAQRTRPVGGSSRELAAGHAVAAVCLQLTRAGQDSSRRLAAAFKQQQTDTMLPVFLIPLLLCCWRYVVACRVLSTETSSWRTRCWTAAHAHWSRSVTLGTQRFVGANPSDSSWNVVVYVCAARNSLCQRCWELDRLRQGVCAECCRWCWLLCRAVQHEKFQSAPGSRVGTPAYLAPEVILTTRGKTYDGKVRRAGQAGRVAAQCLGALLGCSGLVLVLGT